MQQNIIGSSNLMLKTLDQVSDLAPIERPVLVLGERGTGKELVAQRLHFLSGRWQGPLLQVNCAALNENLLDSELFGHESGAFTGASRQHKGKFEQAHGGTLVMDELGTMSLRLQEKLLRVLEYGQFERVGGQQGVQVDVRVVGSTNANLAELVVAGEFRADLLDRLSFDVVHVPPLRLREEDVLQLAEHFAVRMSHELGGQFFAGFTNAMNSKLLAYNWPGNVRELRNVVERSLARWGQPEEPLGELWFDVLASPFVETGSAELSDIPLIADISDTGLPFKDQVASFEKQLLEQALIAHQHHQSRTAQALGLSYHQLRGMLKKHALVGDAND